MSGNISGGLKAAETTKLRHGKDFYSTIGKMGGAKGHTGGTYGRPEWAAYIGSIGGKKSRRGKAIPKINFKDLAPHLKDALSVKVGFDTKETPKSRIPFLRKLFRKKVA